VLPRQAFTAPHGTATRFPGSRMLALALAADAELFSLRRPE